MSDDPNTVYHVGDQLANPTATTGSDSGTLGCFATTNDGAVVLLSCAHVLFANETSESDTNLAIYSPPSSSTCCRHRHIATTQKRWQDGFDGKDHGSAVPVTTYADPLPPDNKPTQFQGFFTDCAIAKLEPAVLYSNEVPGGIGMISGTPTGGLGVVAPPAWGTDPTPDQVVKFYSGVTKRVHYGTLLAPPTPGGILNGARLDPLQWPDAAGGDSDKRSDTKALVGGLVVMPRPAPGESLETYAHGNRRLIFGQSGDSGAVVLNSTNQVIGVICRGYDPDTPWKPNLPELNQYAEWRAVSGVGTLSPIGNVLAQMQITIPAGLAKTTPSAGDALATPWVEDSEELALRIGQRRVAAQLQQSRMGRVLLEKLARHRTEARRIVERNRHAMVAWRRCQGPAFVNHCIRNLRNPAHRLPSSINGVSRLELGRVMAEILLTHGSPKLRRDVERYRDVALAYGPALLSLDDVAPAILAMESERRTPRMSP